MAGHVDLARAIERSPSAVRRRLSVLRDGGVLAGFVAVPAPQVVGLEGTAAIWKETAPAPDLLALDGTIMAGNSVGGGTLAGGYAVRADDWLEAATNTVGAEPTTRMPVNRYEGPTLGKLDLRVIRAIVERPRDSAERLAARSGLSAKTVRNRRHRLLEDGAVRIYPMFRTGRSDDLIYHLHVTCTAKEVPDVAALLPGASIAPEAQPILCAFVRATTLGDQAATLAQIRALGVENVEVITENEWEVHTEHVVAMVDAALARWE